MLIRSAGPIFRKPQLYSFLAAENAGLDTGNWVQGLAITPSASANTKGSYTQLIASTARQVRTIGLGVLCNPNGTASKSWLVDIAIGGAGSEVVVIPNITVAATAQYASQRIFLRLPFNIPAGTRIAARCQTQAASGETCFVKLTLEDGTVGAAGVDSLNASTSTSLGTAITPGAGSKSSYVQLIASTSRAYNGVFFVFDPQGAAGGNAPWVAMDFATGAGASEVVFYPDFIFWDNSGHFDGANTPYIPFYIPAGTRIAVRARGGGTSNAMGVSAYGVY